MSENKHRSWWYYDGIPALSFDFDDPVTEAEARKRIREWFGVKRLGVDVGPNTEANQEMLARSYAEDQEKLPGWARGPL